MDVLPPLVTGVLLFVVWGTTAVRLIWTRHGAVNSRQNAFLVLASITMLLSRSWVHQPLDTAFGLGMSRHLGNAVIMLAFASLFSLVVAWVLGPERWPGVHVASMLGAAVLGLALLALGAPASSAGERIETFGGWQYPAYFGIYAIPSLTFAGAIVGISVSGLRRTTDRPDRRVFGALLALACVAAIDTTSMVAAAVMSALGVTNGFTEFRVAVNGIPTMFLLIAMCIFAVRPAVREALIGFGLDADSRMRRRLTPLWQTLSAAVPEVVLELRPADRSALPPAMALHRMCVEIRDAMLVLAEYPQFGRFPPAGEDRDLSIAIGLHLSCLARAGGEEPDGGRDSVVPTVTGHDHIMSTSVDLRSEARELSRLAHVWERAGRMARNWVDYRESVLA
ncbi:MAG: hypothetical protein GX610_21910 [Rhodococcus sp.]|nr:hypothetical protein [Rhodococcus sp. (in: high G+C Gram-positive bacteria)]